MNKLSLIDFLPSYTDINTKPEDPVYSYYSKYIPSGYNEFSVSTFLKREFNELKLDQGEPPRVAGKFTPLNQQLFVSRFLSPHTPYNALLVYNEVGSGKTLSAGMLSETAKEANPDLQKTLILVSNDNLRRNFQNELAFAFPDKYKLSEYDSQTGQKLTEDTYIRRFNALINKNYLFNTYRVFAKELIEMSDQDIINTYSNRVIIVDEVHHVNFKSKKAKQTIHKNPCSEEDLINDTVYDQLHRMFHLVKNVKIVLLSATPMYDKASEIAGLLNLILPCDQQFDLDTFENEYFLNNVFRENKVQEFKDKLRGLVSYVRSSTSDVKKFYEGEILSIGNTQMRKMKLVEADMSDIQSEAYNNAYIQDGINISGNNENDIEQEVSADVSDEKPKGLFRNTNQASLMVAPDGTWGSDMTSKWFIVPDKKDKKTLTKVSKELKKFILKSGSDNENKLKQLSKLSAKYAGIIRNLLETPKETSFVYSNLVDNSGLNALAAILELFDFNHAPLPESSNINLEKYKSPEGKRHFLLITGKFPSSKQASILANKVFSNKENIYGDYIQVILASKIVSEGVSFKGARQFHLINPWWNKTAINQSQGRIDRSFAHQYFPKEEKYMKLFYWCALPEDKSTSLDLYMYKRSEDKDYPIKQVERLLKESAVDCALNIKRNQRPDLNEDGSPECDYASCIYECDGLPLEWYTPNTKYSPDLIIDSYNLYYGQYQIDEIKDEIRSLFKQKYTYDFSEFKSIFNDRTEIILLRALKQFIDNSEIILNKYGFPNYLREQNNFYFLIDNLEYDYSPDLYLLSCYTKYPFLHEDMTFANFVKYYEIVYMDKLLDNLSNVKSDEVLHKSLDFLDVSIQEKILEGFLEAENKKISFNEELRAKVLKYYSSYIVDHSDYIISSLLYEENKIYRCYDKEHEEWDNCPSDIIQKIQEVKHEKKKEFEITPYKYYGIVSADGKFKIRTIFAAGDKRRTGREGTSCNSGAFTPANLRALYLRLDNKAEEISEKNKPSLWGDYLSDELKKDIGSEKLKASSYNNSSPEKVYELLQKLKANNLVDPPSDEPVVPEKTLEELKEFDKDRLARWYSFLNVANAKRIMCPFLKEWFESVGWLQRL